MNLLSKIFKPSIDGIIADITNKIKQLHVAAEFHAEEQAIHDKIVSERKALSLFAANEWARAKRLAEKFEALVA